MSKIVIFSDLHAHGFKPYSTILENGLNSRLADAINCVEAVLDHAKRIEADLVLFAGDLFHERKHVITQAFNITFETLAKFAAAQIPLVMIHGNHDQADRAGKFHSLRSFGVFSTVLDQPGWCTVYGREQEYSLLAVPYVEDYRHLLDVVQNKPEMDDLLPRIFLGHFGVVGASVGSDFVYNNSNELSIPDLPVDSVDVGFLGHFHMHQQLSNNFWYVGAPLQHNWGDIGQERGFMEYDTMTKKSKFIPINNSPKFVEMSIHDAAKSPLQENNFVRIVSNKPWSADQIETTRNALRAASLEVVGTMVDANEAFEARLAVDPGASYEEMVTEYVNSGLVDLEGLEEDYLVNIAKRVLAEVS